MADRSQKTEKPTQRKLKEARREGQVARSPEVGAWLGLLLAVFLVRLTMGKTTSAARNAFHEVAGIIEKPDIGQSLHLLGSAMGAAAVAAAPLCLGAMVVGLGASVAQGGLRISLKALGARWRNLNPLTGLKRMFGPRGAWEAAKALGKTGLLALVLFDTVRSLVPLTTSAQVLPLAAVTHVAGEAIFRFARDAALIGLGLAALDYAYQLRRYRSSLRMTKQEVKEELRTTEGDPRIKSAIRSRQMALRRRRMIREVAKADVVVVNPIHIAVALRYTAGSGAPRVVAKGAGSIAGRIREEAMRHRVPIVEDVPLARTLYRVCDLGQEIPRELFVAVARVLAFVFTLKRKGTVGGLHRPRPTPPSELAGVRRGRRRTRRRPVLLR
ncbi:MAG: EscU/YscU/HrcU family type III secretion system export apparatus switch protein [Acidothermus sp.]|nr:EscU/YscU/HrcU family type III secretion system export apparatus switch protein [Acidothermus sp.]